MSCEIKKIANLLDLPEVKNRLFGALASKCEFFSMLLKTKMIKHLSYIIFVNHMISNYSD